jgi:hypothetical protein
MNKENGPKGKDQEKGANVTPNLQCHRSAKENGPKKNGANTGMRLKSKPIAVYYSAFNVAKSARQTMVTMVEWRGPNDDTCLGQWLFFSFISLITFFALFRFYDYYMLFYTQRDDKQSTNGAQPPNGIL